MAKKNAKNGNSEKHMEAPPDGFTINVGRERGDGWVKKEEGNIVQGRLLGRHTYTSRGKKRAYYQVKLARPCKAEIENPDWNEEMEGDEVPERITATLDEGSIVNLDETTKLADLETHVSSGGVYDVWLVFGNKMDIGNGQTMWTVTGPRLRVVEKPDELPY